MPKYEVGPDDRIVVALKRPAKEAGVEKPALTMRAPTVRDTLLADKVAKSPEEQEILLLANLTDVTVDCIKGLRLADLNRLRQAFQAFVSAGEDEEAEVGDADTFAVKLGRPAEDKGVPLPVLTMRAPTVGDQMAGAKGAKSAAEREIALFASLCAVEPDTIKGLRMADYARLQAAFRGFLAADAEDGRDD